MEKKKQKLIPKGLNGLLSPYALTPFTYSEFILSLDPKTQEIIDNKELIDNYLSKDQTHQLYQKDKPLSPNDPFGEFYVGTAAGKILEYPIKLIGKAGLYGLGRLGNKWARAKLISGALDNSKPNIQRIIPLELGLVGWAPRLLFYGYHASDDPNLVIDFWKKGWPQIIHDAPYGFYAAAGRSPKSGFLSKRPYLYNVGISFRKPMVQVGEIPAKYKNATRNTIERFAQDSGADGIIYQGIADNQMTNLTVAKTLNPDTKIYLHTPKYKSNHDIPMITDVNKFDPEKWEEFRNMIKSAKSNLHDYHYESEEYRLAARDAGFVSDEDFYRLLKQYDSNMENTKINIKPELVVTNKAGTTETIGFENPEISLNPYIADYETLLHELLHARSANLDETITAPIYNQSYIQKAVKYNNSIRPYIDLDIAKQSGISFDRAEYLSDYQELTARAKQIALAAYNKGVSIKDFVNDKVNHSFRPLSDLMEAYNLNDIINYSSKALSALPAAYVGSKTINPKQNDISRNHN